MTVNTGKTRYVLFVVPKTFLSLKFLRFYSNFLNSKKVWKVGWSQTLIIDFLTSWAKLFPQNTTLDIILNQTEVEIDFIYFET